MKKPEMILFDYGHTLVYEPSFDREAGFRAVLAHCFVNPSRSTAQQLADEYASALERLITASREADCDFLDMACKRLLYESARLKFDCGLIELEQIFWDAAGPGRPMPGIEMLLSELHSLGIRSGVLSNMNFREVNVRARIDRLLPNNDFEFVLCSCEYATRKPRPEFFELALKQANLAATEVWYCGDNPRCDVLGAANAGLTPVWYENELSCPYRTSADRIPVSLPCMHIREWHELIGVLAGLK